MKYQFAASVRKILVAQWASTVKTPLVDHANENISVFGRSCIRATVLYPSNEALFLLRYEHLLRARAPESAAYQFLPYLHGPYSFALAHELEGLLAVGELRQGEKGRLVRPPELGTVKLASDLKRVIEGLLHSFGGLRKDELVRSVYERYPWFTLNAKDLRCRKVKPPTSVPGIYLAGYEGLQVDGFLNLLLESGIRRLIDIRANPVSRKFGFHGSTLRSLCNKLAIGYEHVPALGIASAWRTRLDPSRRDGYDDLFSRYESEVLPVGKTRDQAGS